MSRFSIPDSSSKQDEASSPMTDASAAVSRSTGRLGNVTGALLLGGRSKRMGRDKARIEWRGRRGSTRAAELLAGLFEETLLVGGEPEPQAPGRRISDAAGPACPLRGLVSALEAATCDRVLVLATDLPLLSGDLLLALTAWPESVAVVPTDAQRDHPLCAIYRREACLESARRRLETGRLALHDWLDEIEAERVTLSRLGFGANDGALLANLNTPEELARLEAR
jgi:molybdopterin-guanine dinucleotide biosynthesis protein A